MKFQKNSYGYILTTHQGSKPDVFAEGYIKLIKVHITKVDKRYVEGFHLERYGSLILRDPTADRYITTKRKKKGGKPVPFHVDDYVAYSKKYSSEQLLTLEEAKMRMIEYIVTDFGNKDIGYFNVDTEDY